MPPRVRIVRGASFLAFPLAGPYDVYGLTWPHLHFLDCQTLAASISDPAMESPLTWVRVPANLISGPQDDVGMR